MTSQPATWYFLRHAEKIRDDHYNPHLRHQDPPISGRGCQAAAAVARYLADKALAAIYVSAYRRTWQTAAATAERCQLSPILDERLNEFDSGVAEPLSEAEFQQAYPDAWLSFTLGTADFRWPGGETGAEAQARIVDFVTEKTRQHAGENVLVVSHDGLLRLWLCHVLGLPVYRRGAFQTSYCGLTELRYEPGPARWVLIRFNQACPP
jgi:probable phosphoglycerate mutase